MKLAIVSGKGGVGKSTFSALLAYHISLKKKTLLIDFDLSGPSISNIFPSTEKILVRENGITPISYSFNLNILSVGYMIRKTDVVIWRTPKRLSLLSLFMKESNMYENLIIDSAPGICDDMQLINCPVIIISTSNNIALQDAAVSIEYFKERNIPILGIVENMSGLRCSNCSTTNYYYARNGCKQLADYYNIEYLGDIPIDQNMVQFIEQGRKNEADYKKLKVYAAIENIYAKIINFA